MKIIARVSTAKGMIALYRIAMSGTDIAMHLVGNTRDHQRLWDIFTRKGVDCDVHILAPDIPGALVWTDAPPRKRGEAISGQEIVLDGGRWGDDYTPLAAITPEEIIGVLGYYVREAEVDSLPNPPMGAFAGKSSLMDFLKENREIAPPYLKLHWLEDMIANATGGTSLSRYCPGTRRDNDVPGGTSPRDRDEGVESFSSKFIPVVGKGVLVGADAGKPTTFVEVGFESPTSRLELEAALGVDAVFYASPIAGKGIVPGDIQYIPRSW